MSFTLNEDAALPDATRVFIGNCPAAGTLAAILIDDFTPNFTTVSSVQIDSVEQLPHVFTVAALLTAQENESLTYGAVLENSVVTVHLLGDASSVSAEVT